MKNFNRINLTYFNLNHSKKNFNSNFDNYRKRLHTSPGLIPKIPPKEHALNTINVFNFPLLSPCDYSRFLTINPSYFSTLNFKFFEFWVKTRVLFKISAKK